MQQANRSYRILCISALLTLCLAASVTVASAAPATASGTKKAYLAAVVPYDVNGDGRVNEADVRCLRQHLMGETPQSFSAAAADVDQSGRIDAKDVALLQQYLRNNASSSTSSVVTTTTRPYDDNDGWSPILP